MPEAETRLTVNNVPIELSGFPKEFLPGTVVGAISSLKKVGEIKDMAVSLDSGRVTVLVNGEKIPLSPFPNNIIASTLSGLLVALKGVGGRVESFRIEIRMRKE